MRFYMSNYFDHLLLVGRIAALLRCDLLLQMEYGLYDSVVSRSVSWSVGHDSPANKNG